MLDDGDGDGSDDKKKRKEHEVIVVVVVGGLMDDMRMVTEPQSAIGSVSVMVGVSILGTRVVV
jgi:hypothetical protein